MKSINAIFIRLLFLFRGEGKKAIQSQRGAKDKAEGSSSPTIGLVGTKINSIPNQSDYKSR